MDMKPLLISVEGTIGAGKSSLLNKLKSHYLVKKEPVEEWSEKWLDKYYREPKEHAFDFQKEVIKTFDTKEIAETTVIERSLYSLQHVFCHLAYKRKYLDNKQNAILSSCVEQMLNKTEPLQAIFYLQIPSLTSYFRMRYRNRPGEETVRLSYLARLQRRYDEVFVYNKHNLGIPVYILNGELKPDELASKIIQIVESFDSESIKTKNPPFHINYEPHYPKLLLNTLKCGVEPINFYRDVQDAIGEETEEPYVYPHLFLSQLKDSALPPSVKNDKEYNLYCARDITISPNEEKELRSGIYVKAPKGYNIKIRVKPVGREEQQSGKLLLENQGTWLDAKIKNDTKENITYKRCEVFATLSFEYSAEVLD